ncbi:MAG TPA: transcription antitermination factor NusB [Acidimicrobiales bacterium]|nr:transcription antitermination factor NusB [Acidimicrobiales bacterium]
MPPTPNEDAGAAPRHQQRERALSLLYEADLKREDPVAVGDALAVPPDPYVRALLAQVSATKEEAERRIAAASVGWPLDRMAVIDRLVLRLAVAELLDPAGPPPAVVIDEAVELAKVYSTDDSGRFVNGILAALAPDLRRPAS